MRYFNQPDIEFDGVLIKGELPLQPKSEAVKTLENYSGDFLDSVAVLHYGDGMETEAYRIFNENIIPITEAGFDLSKIFTLRAPF